VKWMREEQQMHLQLADPLPSPAAWRSTRPDSATGMMGCGKQKRPICQVLQQCSWSHHHHLACRTSSALGAAEAAAEVMECLFLSSGTPLVLLRLHSWSLLLHILGSTCRLWDVAATSGSRA
jgi:hypothetical protein